MSKHIVEGVSQLISNLLDLQLLSVDLVLDVVNPLVQLGDVHLSVLEPALGDLVLILDAEDLLLQFLLSLHSLLGAELELLHVLTDHLELLLDVLQLALCQLCSLDGSLKFLLLDSKFPGELVKLLLIVAGHLGGLPQVFVQLLNGDLIVHALALNNLDFLQDLIGCLEDRASLVTVLARLTSAFLDSSSINMILRLRAAMSASTSLCILSFSSKLSLALLSLSVVSSNSISNP